MSHYELHFADFLRSSFPADDVVTTWTIGFIQKQRATFGIQIGKVVWNYDPKTRELFKGSTLGEMVPVDDQVMSNKLHILCIVAKLKGMF